MQVDEAKSAELVTMLKGLAFSAVEARNKTEKRQMERMSMIPMVFFRAVTVFALVSLGGAAWAAEYPPPKQGDWVAHDFRFHSGEVVSELKLHC